MQQLATDNRDAAGKKIPEACCSTRYPVVQGSDMDEILSVTASDDSYEYISGSDEEEGITMQQSSITPSQMSTSKVPMSSPQG